MKISLFIIIVIIGTTLKAQKIEYKLFIQDDCKNSIRNESSYILKSKDSIFYPNKKGIAQVKNVGNYELWLLGQEEHIEIIIDKPKLNIDTISLPTIKFKIETTTRPSFSGFFCCEKLCDGICTDYYFNGEKRIEGKFKNGRACGEIRYYNKQGILVEGRYFDKYGKVMKLKKHNTPDRSSIKAHD